LVHITDNSLNFQRIISADSFKQEALPLQAQSGATYPITLNASLVLENFGEYECKKEIRKYK
jgi:hypothetical protein